MHRIPAFSSRVSSAIGGLVLGALILATGLSPTLVHAQQDRQMVDRIVAVVGDNIVLKSEVDQLVRRQTQRQGVSFSSDLWMKSLQQLVDRNLLAEKARRDTTLTISDQQVTNALNRRLKQLKRRAGGEKKLEKIYGKSILEIKKSFRDDLRDQLLATRLRERRKRKIEITPSEVKQWFDEIPKDSLPRVPKTVRLSHIVRYPKPTEEAREEAKSLISAIRDSIVSDKASFASMARKYSDDSGTAQSGGRLTGVSVNDLVPEFAAVVTQTPVGEVSQVFYNDSQNGYHILRVNSKSGNTLDLNHILIKTPPSEERAIEYLSAVRDTLLSNEDVSFALMARRHSEEERTASNGGQVTDPKTGTPDLVLKQLGPSWKRTIRKLEPSEISKPAEVKLLNGKQAYHIVRLERRIAAHRVNLETDYMRIRKFALRDKRNRKMREWLDRLRNEIYVDIRVSKSDLAAMRLR
ncbi:MAG: peptidylprolyl isomerase [Salinibacter sp.]|uniref:peptidylprolyl isomerase n=1 Tax=Salinibacter sp. TaxID=2065818 RepID=UPI0035D3EF18